MIERKLNTVFIPVANLKESVDWYGEVLGFEKDPEQYQYIDKLPVYTFQMGETSLTLEEEKGYTSSASSVPLCNFHTGQIEEVRKSFQEKGVRIESELTTFVDFSYFNFRDINGNLLMICTG
ncbi:VOC family protein (plasmid) [Cytobacillus spongiae]|uniref:VOC family protein n=1 Tax=Cytobacillus spongiae TaxID=2901381 RepID=UPI001F3F269D|nr:VOC family protein [Cytobacillus spongiae]UII58577.1 VOC family protein [Cytobacillus spongiae]